MKIAEITPLQVWNEGEQVEVNNLGVEICYDNLVSSASFKYVLFYEQNPIITGYSVLDGQDYIDWGDSSDINEDAVIRIAAKLNLSLV